MNTAVTGGSGVVGQAVVRHLIADGHEVRALARSDESAALLAEMGAEVTRGDLLDAGSIDSLVRGRDWMFHIGGVNELCSADPYRVWKVNVEGTRIVLGACRRGDVGRLVHTSSAVTLGEAHGTVGSENTVHRGSYLSDYERSKHAAERLLFQRAAGLDVVAVNPSSVQGPGRGTGSAVLLMEAVRGRSPFLVDTVFSLVDIDDCARGHLLAAAKGGTGQRYVLSGSVTSAREVVRTLNQALGRHWAPFYLNQWVVSAAASVAGSVARFLGKTSPLCPESARVLFHGSRYDGSRATRELGLEYTPLEDTLKRAVSWFAAVGLIQR